MLGDPGGGGVVDEQHEVRVPHAGGVALVVRAVVRRRARSNGDRRVERDPRGVERDRPHVDGGRRPRRPCRRRGRASTARRPPPVSTTRVPLRPETFAGRDPGEAAHAVAAHLGDAAVGVVEHHLRVGTVDAGLDHDQPVGTDAAVTVAERRGLRGVDPGDPGVRRAATTRRGSRSRWRAASTAGWSSCAPACQERGEERARIPGRPEPPDPGVAPEPHALATGELPGADDRGRRTRRRARGSRRRGGPSTSWYPMAWRRCATARRRAARPRDLVDQAGPAHRARTGARSGRARTARGQPHPGDADREHRWPRTPGGRHRTTRTVAR